MLARDRRGDERAGFVARIDGVGRGPRVVGEGGAMGQALQPPMYDISILRAFAVSAVRISE